MSTSDSIQVRVVDKHAARRGGGKKNGRKKSKRNAMNDTLPSECLNLKDKIYSFRRVALYGTISQQALSSSFLAMYFSLDLNSGFTEFTNLFDEYRICAVEVIFRPKYNMQTIASINNIVTPFLYTAIDYDDSTAPTNISQIEEYQTCVVTNFNGKCRRTIKPKVAMEVYQGITTSAYALARPWVDCANTGVRWFGLKAGVEAGASGQTALQTWEITCEYYLQFRNVR